MRSTEQKVLRWEARAVLSMSPCERARARWGWPRTATVARAGSSRRRQAAPVASGRRGLLGPCLGRARPPGLQHTRSAPPLSPRPPPAEGGAWPAGVLQPQGADDVCAPRGRGGQGPPGIRWSGDPVQGGKQSSKRRGAPRRGGGSGDSRCPGL